MSLTYHPYKGYRVPFDPNCTQDDARIAREAQAKRKAVGDYVRERLAYHWPDGSPAYTQDAAAPAAGAVSAPAAPAPAAPGSAVPPRKKP